jgi:hypothetical protein
MIAGFTSPSRNWFRLSTPDESLLEKHSISKWLNVVERAVRNELGRSKFYAAMAKGVYPDLSLIGTACLFHEETVMGQRFESLVTGEYWLDVDPDGKVDTCIRERYHTVRQVVDRFGVDRCSAQTQQSYNRRQYGDPVLVAQAVYPNKDFIHGRVNPENMAFASRWWEVKSPVSQGFLATKGYHEFPVHAPRWSTVSGETYGRGSPGWETKGDCSALQFRERELAKAIAKQVSPPMRASQAMKSERLSLLPSDVTYTPNSDAHSFAPAMTIPPGAINEQRQEIERHEMRIDQGWFVDLWMSLFNDQRRQRPTATEVTETKQETMLQLGALIESLNDDLLEPTIIRTFSILERQGKIPPVPEELQGSTLKLEFVSIMHQAQKLTGLASMRELVASVGMLAQVGKLDAIDKINSDAYIDELGDILAIKPDLIYSDDEVAKMRQEALQQQQAQQQGQSMLTATEGAKNLSGVDPQKISDIAASLAPAASSSAGLT